VKRYMHKREAEFQTYFNSWLRNVHKETGLYELKVAVTDKLLMSRLEEHQKDWLLAVKHGTAVHKMPDAGFTNPADCWCMTEQPAYVVVKYYGKEDFFLIDIDDWCKETTKSLKYERARKIASVISYKICQTCGKHIPMYKQKYCSDKCQRQ